MCMRLYFRPLRYEFNLCTQRYPVNSSRETKSVLLTCGIYEVCCIDSFASCIWPDWQLDDRVKIVSYASLPLRTLRILVQLDLDHVRPIVWTYPRELLSWSERVDQTLGVVCMTARNDLNPGFRWFPKALNTKVLMADCTALFRAVVWIPLR